MQTRTPYAHCTHRHTPQREYPTRIHSLHTRACTHTRVHAHTHSQPLRTRDRAAVTAHSLGSMSVNRGLFRTCCVPGFLLRDFGDTKISKNLNTFPSGGKKPHSGAESSRKETQSELLKPPFPVLENSQMPGTAEQADLGGLPRGSPAWLGLWGEAQSPECCWHGVRDMHGPGYSWAGGPG